MLFPSADEDPNHAQISETLADNVIVAMIDIRDHCINKMSRGLPYLDFKKHVHTIKSMAKTTEMYAKYAHLFAEKAEVLRNDNYEDAKKHVGTIKENMAEIYSKLEWADGVLKRKKETYDKAFGDKPKQNKVFLT